MLINHDQSRTGKEKVVANEEKGRRGPEKDRHMCFFWGGGGSLQKTHLKPQLGGGGC